MTDPSPLPRTLALAKNTRGVAVFDPNDPPNREVFTWLARRHQYRTVGFPPSLFDAHPSIDLGEYETFTELELPFTALDTLVGELETAAPAWVTESLVVASTYAAPLFIHVPVLGSFEPFAIWRLTAAEDLPSEQVLRHMRILGYGTIDFHADATTRAYEAIVSDAVAAERDRRAAIAHEDGVDRCWRLIEQDDHAGETHIGGYYDVLSAVGPSVQETIAEDPRAAMVLGVIGGMAIDPPS